MGTLAGNSTGTSAGSSSGGMIPGSSNGVTPGSSTRGETGDCEVARKFGLDGRVKVSEEVELEPADKGVQGHEVLNRSDSSFKTLLASWRLVTAFSCILTRSSDVDFCSMAVSKFCTRSALISKAIMMSCEIAISSWSVQATDACSSMRHTIASLECDSMLFAAQLISSLNLARSGSQYVEEKGFMLITLNRLLFVPFHYFCHELCTIAKRSSDEVHAF